MASRLSSWWGRADLSDIDVVIRIRGDAGPQERRRLQLHAVVLAAASPWVDAAVTRWSEQPPQTPSLATAGPNKRPRRSCTMDPASRDVEQAQPQQHRCVYMDVEDDTDAEHLELVLEQAYTQQLPEGVSQHDLLRMAAVADAFELRDGAAACLAHLAELPTDELLWVTVTAALTLPSGLAALPAAKKLVKRATRRLRHVLGDLEETLQRSRGVLEALPLPALLALLRHSKTSVASEGTAVAAVALWVAAQQRAGASVSGEQLRQLAGCIRMMQLPFTYLGTVLPRIGWLAGIITPAHIAALTTAKGVAAADGSMDEFKADVLSGSDSDSGLWSAWLAKARPASERTRVAVQLAAHKDLILSGKELPLSSEGVEAWGGYWWGLRLLTQMDASFQLQVALEAIGSVGGGAGPPAQQQLLLEPAAFVHASLDCLTGGGKDKITASYTCLLVDNASLDAFNLIAHRDPSFGLLPGELTPFLHNDRLRLRLTVRELH